MQVKTIGETSILLAMSLLLPFGLCAGELPDGFRQVSYIQSSGTQHIDIDYALKYGDSFVVEFLPLENTAIDPKGGELEIDYVLDLEHSFVTRNLFRIEVWEQEPIA